ncbi:hypothetical protein HQ560_15585 [bacterium]|nr:hypothetical protein [bacterium]
MRILQLAVLGLAGFLAGCGGGGPSIGGDPDRAVLTDTAGVQVTITDANVIGLLVEAVQEAVPDDGKYIAALDRTLEFQGGGESLLTLKFRGGLLTTEQGQYMDEPATIARIAAPMLDCKAPLYGELDYEWTVPAGGTVALKYTVTNVGGEPMILATTLRARIDFRRVFGEDMDTDEETPSVVTAGDQRYVDVKGGKPIDLSPGASHVYTINVSVEEIDPGRKAMALEFYKRRGEDVEEPTTEVYPPPIPGMLLTIE